jgi:hypothetical protein
MVQIRPPEARLGMAYHFSGISLLPLLTYHPPS